jgi:ribosomal protein L40E
MRGGVFRLAPNLGVECPHCGTKLLIVQTRVYAALGFLLLVLLFGGSGFASLKHKAHLDPLEEVQAFCAFGAIIGLAFLPLFAPSLWRLRPIRDGEAEAMVFPLGTPKAEEDATPGWICPKCHEKNPENFEICWKCEHARPKAAGI